jgi:cytochrome c553
MKVLISAKNLLAVAGVMLVSLTLAPLASAQGAAASGDAAQGQKKASMCIGCHGIPGYQASFPEIHKVPMIAGQNAKYIVSSLAAYQKGDRRHPTMRSIAAALSEKDMADLAAYYETQGGPRAELPKEPELAPSPKVAELLKKGNCASCHGANFSTPIDASYPKLSGQHADYLNVALRSYQVDKNPQVGRANAIMRSQVAAFSREELKLMAKYLGSLPGDLKTVPQSRLH